MRNKKVERSTNEATSAEKVASIDDILTQILLLLPIKSLVRFISVSKHWLKLIKNPQFSFNRNPNPNPALGLFLQRTAYKKRPTFEYVNFSKQSPHSPPFRNLEFLDNSSSLRILQSCNGLLLCFSNQLDGIWNRKKYFVCNPTTKDFIRLPKSFHENDVSTRIRGLSLVFDPSRSPEYKVISVWSDIKYQIEIYSSLIKTWRKSGNVVSQTLDFKFRDLLERFNALDQSE
ncbi:hypothetical protein Leryth_006946 [Lithospermum erythrorhizon]|nr:hypothetical protein Leryth_006946 [Lithospermum erythrorhizon]